MLDMSRFLIVKNNVKVSLHKTYLGLMSLSIPATVHGGITERLALDTKLFLI